jgi:hypothetical protein
VELQLERGDLRAKDEELVFDEAIPLAAVLVLFLRRDQALRTGGTGCTGIAGTRKARQ